MTALANRRSSRSRRGFTLVEVLVTMAVIVIIGGILVPTVRSMSRDSKPKAAADTLMGRVADARGAAIEAGMPYRLAVSADGKRVMVAPDTESFATQSGGSANAMITQTDLPGDVIATIQSDEGGEAAPEDGDWIRVATFQPNGTCREDFVTVLLSEPGVRSFLVRIRGLTGAATTETAPAPGTSNGATTGKPL